MIRITINQAAFDAIASTLPLGSVAYEQEPDANGERQIWLAADVVNRLVARVRAPARATGPSFCGWRRTSLGKPYLRR